MGLLFNPITFFLTYMVAAGMDSGGDVEAPDYSGIAAANEEAARLAAESAAADLDFRKQQYTDNLPYINDLRQTATDVADEQLGAMRTANERSADQWDQYTQTFRPIEERMASEAMEYGGASDQERAASSAVSDVQQQSGIARDSAERNLQAMGVNPNSGRFAATSAATDLRTSAARAGAATSARTTARDKGIALRSGAAAFGRNQTNTAGQMVGIGTNAGNSGVSAAGAGANALLPTASFTAGGFGSGIQAAGVQQQGALGMGNLINSGYGMQLNAQAQSDSGMGSFVGGLGMLGASMMMSSKTVKHDRAAIDGESVLEKIEDIPVEAWTYNAGAADEGRHIGPYAEDVNAKFGDTVAPHGRAIDVISMIGLNMKALQELSAQVKELKQEVAA